MTRLGAERLIVNARSSFHLKLELLVNNVAQPEITK